ncbi:MAG: 6-phosphofructokinase [Verrucomicrobiota bacterium]|nr:6-phosphofructokinase [Verrucomicrobiota bacterium]MDP7179313.1 6-phosphofructokinase [Verrucomicrobiota bacterium]MDP7441406.1 6-phosphofructokinase [Verrucomicrobiota bacterium]
MNAEPETPTASANDNLVGNLLVGQSGGPTAVINASVAGVIQEAGRHPDHIEEIYGGLNGIFGILQENLIDLNDEKARTIEELKHTPAAALGTCRYKIRFKKDPEQAARDMDRLFEVFKAHNIRYFFYAGGNDSQDTNNKLHHEAIKRGYPMRCIGVPKTIDNDLPHTDHTPGYGSAVKYNATTVMEIAQDVASMATDDGSCCIIEVMGRAAGWLAAGTVLAKRKPTDGPHIVLLPEIPLDEEKFLAKVQETVHQLGYCIVVTGEGVKDKDGNELGADKTRLDSFGHPVLSGAADTLCELVHGKLELKTRTVKLGYAQRSAAHFASQQDVDEAVACGVAAVRAAVEGKSGFMVTIERRSDDPYEYTTGLHPLGDIALLERTVPRDWISEDGWLPNEKFIQYSSPLVRGRLDLPTKGGLPKFAELTRIPVEKVLAPRSPLVFPVTA